MIILAGKAMVVGYHLFRKHPCGKYSHYLRGVSSQFSTRDDALGAVLAAQGPTFSNERFHGIEATEFWAPNLGGFLEGKSPKISGQSRLGKYYSCYILSFGQMG